MIGMIACRLKSCHKSIAQELTSNPRHAYYADGERRSRCRAKFVTTIYKICDQAAWEEAQSAGKYRGSPVDHRDGFIHFSTAAQLPGTAAKHFAGLRGLVLAAVDGATLGADLRWEPSRGGELFPHLYAALPLSAVLWTLPLADEVDGHRAFPELVT
jgi:uncharacterized protein (DUF952 family)